MTLNTRNMTTASAAADEMDEVAVEEVHCSECNAPMPAIPNWYANVRVRFACDACRQKSPRLTAAVPPLEGIAQTEPASALDDDAEAATDDIDADAEAEDVELDEAEPVVDEEP